ncbi:hypothetical protein [Phreatobacter stygius]|uniref:Uncharacterized protein n=1 Tax=Phreatobacter stygius TaxID=1940610 RepID=A0A4D7AZC9_9HYPH|nr:hypothetical protein [Phreatobacter stygius]QCI63080.1 hypothetical protein E8M01_01780 [Phreatobacter stygius]
MTKLFAHLEADGSYSPDVLAMMQVIHMSVCAELAVPLDDHVTREAVAEAIVRQIDLGNHDVTAVTETARSAARTTS